MGERVLFFSLSSGLYGGEKCLLGMLAQLHAVSGIEPVVVVPAEGLLTAELDRRYIAWVAHALYEPRAKWTLPYDVWRAWAWLRRMEPRLIYMNANSYWRPLELAVAFMMGIPIVTHHHLIPESLPPFHRFSNLIIANSNYVAARLTVSPVVVLDNPVELEAFDQARPDPDAYGMAPGDLGVFYIGQIKSIKGVDTFLDAAVIAGAEVPQARFVLIGDAPDPAYGAHVMERAAAIPNVRWLRFDSRIERAYATADILCMPSSWDEPLGRIAIEAGAAAKPIVCTRVGGIPEVIRDGENGLLVPKANAPRLAQAMIELLRNPELRDRLGTAGRLDAEQRFAAPVVARSLADVLLPLIRKQLTEPRKVT